MIARKEPSGPDVRCAIYTRKSTEEGLDRDFSSLDAQRESCEAYVRSQRGDGWVALPDRYDDGGYTGGNMERPALGRLMAEIEAGRVDCVVVYKVDRLSRSLLDFARMMSLFEKRKVSFVSVTQRFDTSQSMGRLTLNVLLSFAQFERELVSERTRDKIAMTRRRGQWTGSRAPLGYRYDAAASRLVVVEDEAELLRLVFRTYLETGSLERTAAALNAHGHVTKRWTFRDGRTSGGRQWDKPHVRLAIANVTCRGMVAHHDASYPGLHAAIIDEETWIRANALLERNGRRGSEDRIPLRHGLLNGILRCASCDSAMSHVSTAKKDGRTYRYYQCGNAARKGRSACPSPSVPAEEIERFVLSKARMAVRATRVVDATHISVAALAEEERADATARLRAASRDRGRLARDLGVASASRDPEGTVAARLADLHRQIDGNDAAIAAARRELDRADASAHGREETDRLIRLFDPVWDRLAAGERRRLMAALVARVEYDGENGKLSITMAGDFSVESRSGS
ncbi:MAG: recombinase family protein [Phycisphaerae bacterium]|nr:recombinase family protein [Phycisphaerae bacterium]